MRKVTTMCSASWNYIIVCTVIVSFVQVTLASSLKQSAAKRHHHHKSCSKPPHTGSPPAAASKEINSSVDHLVRDIIREYNLRERSIGYHVDDYVSLVQQGHFLFGSIFQSWQSASPSLKTFLSNVTIALNNLKLINSAIVRHVDTINQLGVSSGDIQLRLLVNNQSARETSSRRQRHVHGHHSYKIHSNQTSRHKRSTKEETYWTAFGALVAHLNATKAWYTFLGELESTLGSYDMQTPNRTIDDADFSEWTDRFNITKTNLKDALQRIQAEYGINSLQDTIPLLESTAIRGRIDYLNEIVRATLLKSSVCTQKDEYIFMTGGYVLLSDVLKCVISTVKHVVVIAANRLFVDADIIYSSLTTTSISALTFIAPRWVVVGSKRVINITGEPGKSGNKNDGRPGFPGGNGGNLFGITRNISGGELHILSNGGTGGPGHTGGHHQVQIGCQSPFKETDKPCKIQCGDDCVPGKPCDCSKCDYFCCSSPVNFIRNGKDGGQAGIGGHGGNVEVISTSEVPFESLTIENSSGANGSVGDGGKGKSTTTPPPDSELSAAGIIHINSNAQVYCVKNLSEILHSNPVAKDGEAGKDPRSPEAPEAPAASDVRSMVLGVRKFKVLVINGSHVFSRPGILGAIQYLDNNRTIRDAHKISDFVREYFELNAQSTHWGRHVIPHLYYDSLWRRAFRKVPQNYTDPDDIRVLSFLFAAALSKKLAMSHPFEPNNKINIFQELAVEEYKLNNITAAANELPRQFQKIAFYLVEYQNHIKELSEKSLSFSEQFLLSEVERTEERFASITTRLLESIKKLKGEGNENGLKEARRQLLAHAILNWLFSVIKLASISFNFWNPMGAAIANGADLSYCAPGSNGCEVPSMSNKNIPGYVLNANRRVAFRFRNVTAFHFRGLLGQLNAANKLLSAYPDDFKEVLSEIKVVNETASAMAVDPNNSTDKFPPQDSIYSFKLLLSSLRFIREAQKNLSSLINGVKSARGIQAVSKDEAARLAQAIFSINSEFFNQIGSNMDDIIEVAQQLLMVPDEISTLAAHAQRIQAEMIPDLNQVLKEMGKLMTTQMSKSIATIRWRMQSTILDSKVYFKQVFPQEFDSYKVIDRILEMVDEATTNLITFYEHLYDYHDQTTLLNFLRTAAVDNPNFYFANSNNSTVNNITQLLRYNLLGGLLLKRHQEVASVFRHWRFPFVTGALCSSYKNLLLTSLEVSNKTDVEAFVELIKSATSEMILRSKLEYTEALLQRVTDFESLFVWKNATHSSQINSILQGKTVQLYSDVFKGDRSCDAYKIHRIGINFTSAAGNKTLDEELAAVLKESYFVDLEHLGNSYYVLRDELYVLSGRIFSINFGFKTYPDGKPIITGGYYNGLSSGNYTLSPYGFWNMSLLSLSGPSDNFSRLADKLGLFDMHLEGNGTCITHSFHDIADEYYRPDCSDYFPDGKEIRLENSRTNIMMTSYYDTEDSSALNIMESLPKILSQTFSFRMPESVKQLDELWK